MFTKGNSFGKGRAIGSKNKLPSRKEIVSLIDTIINDLTTNYELLTTQEKLQLLNTFKALYSNDIVLTTQEIFPDNEIRVNIIQANE
jgi:archaellum component FlaC